MLLLLSIAIQKHYMLHYITDVAHQMMHGDAPLQQHNHQQQQHQQLQSTPSSSPPSPFRCEMCSYETPIARNLRIHVTSDKHLQNMAAFNSGGATANRRQNRCGNVVDGASSVGSSSESNNAYSKSIRQHRIDTESMPSSADNRL